MAPIILQYYSENTATDPVSYTYIRDLPLMYVSGITTTTDLKKTVINVPGTNPKIIPQGVNSRTCKINGSYGGGSYPMPTTNLVAAITNDSYITEGYVIKVKSTSVTDIPELYGNQGYWKIINYDVSRDAQKMGKYTFSLVVSYIWTDDSESMLFEVV